MKKPKLNFAADLERWKKEDKEREAREKLLTEKGKELAEIQKQIDALITKREKLKGEL